MNAGLSEAGQEAVAEIARRHEVGIDAVLALLEALERGGGVQAQFSHPELGGMGQWSRGGMIMVGDMFNSGLKARVDGLCNALADLVGDASLYAPRHGGRHGDAWWPEGLGSPTTAGAQNDLRYAFFPEARRLAIARGAHVDVYDTGEHRIHGVSQQQGVGQDLRFTSQLGAVALHELARVGMERAQHRESGPGEGRHEGRLGEGRLGEGRLGGESRLGEAPYGGVGRPGAHQSQSQSQSSSPREMPRVATPTRTETIREREASPQVSPRAASSDDDIFAKIERLHELQTKGVLTEAEFAEKKKELLARI